jgi:hypothetical protein
MSKPIGPMDPVHVDVHPRVPGLSRVYVGEVFVDAWQHDVATHIADQIRDGISRLNSFSGCDGCSTGDCTHDNMSDCLKAQGEMIAQQEAEIHRLQEKIQREPVWLIPDKIVAHTGRCFKLRLDDPGPRIVVEKTGRVTVRAAEKPEEGGE